VDPRSQQLLDAYQQAETYQSGAGTQPDLRVPDYGAPARPPEDLFGNPQQSQPQHGQPQHGQPQHGQPQGQPQYGQPQAAPQQQQPYPGQPQAPYDPQQPYPQQPQQAYEPQQGQYDTQQGYRPQHHQAPGWGAETPAESTIRLDQSALGEQIRQGDDPIDPTAIYTPNEPRR
jgi:hypothetical protein